MIYSANDEGVAALNRLGTCLPEYVSAISDEAERLLAVADEHADLLGVHVGDLRNALGSIQQETRDAAEPIEELSEKTLDTADGYQEVIDRKRFSAGGSGASGAAGGGAGSSSGSGGAAAGAAAGTSSGAAGGAEAGTSDAAGSGQIADHEFSFEQKTAWVKSVVLGASESDAERITRSMEYYSGNGYNLIHWDKNAEMQQTQDILQVFDSGNVGAYQGTIYRGLSFNSKGDLMKALAGGFGSWNEPGITSFTASQSVAEKEFASNGNWGLVLTCTNNKSAIPFRHMSLLSHEDEVLSPGSLRNDGWKIDISSIRVDKTKHIVYADMSEK